MCWQRPVRPGLDYGSPSRGALHRSAAGFPHALRGRPACKPRQRSESQWTGCRRRIPPARSAETKNLAVLRGGGKSYAMPPGRDIGKWRVIFMNAPWLLNFSSIPPRTGVRSGMMKAAWAAGVRGQKKRPGARCSRPCTPHKAAVRTMTGNAARAMWKTGKRKGPSEFEGPWRRQLMGGQAGQATLRGVCVISPLPASRP